MVKRFFSELNYNLLPCRSRVSSFQFNIFKSKGEEYGITVNKNKSGVHVDPFILKGKIETWLKQIEQNSSEVTYCLRIDGRPSNKNDFEVLIALSIIAKEKEISFGNVKCIPLLLYRGKESYAKIRSNTLGFESRLETAFIETKKISCFDAKGFWEVTGEKKFSCPFCHRDTPGKRSICDCSNFKNVIITSLFPTFTSSFVPCILHAKLRIVSHFIELLVTRSFKSDFFFSQLQKKMIQLGIRLKINSDQKNESKIRIGSYAGNECDKIMTNYKELVTAAVSPIDQFQSNLRKSELINVVNSPIGWNLGLYDVTSKRRKDLQSIICKKIIDIASDDKNNNQYSFAITWRNIFRLLIILERGVSSAFSVEKYHSLAIKTKNMWLEHFTKCNIRLYEHLLYNHGSRLLTLYPFGLSGLSQSAMEKCNGDQINFRKKHCFKGDM